MMNIRTREELADAYGESTKVLRKWLREANIVLPPGHISPANLCLIFEKLGPPTKWLSDSGAKLPKLA